MPRGTEQDYLQQITVLITDRLKPVASDEMFACGENLLNLACRHLCVSEHAKRARPLLCLYYHWLFSDSVSKDFINIGVAAEFIHAASLLHDDIVDEADKRRGVITANRMYGNKTAVLAGDFLLTEAFNLLLPFDRMLIDRAISVVREMTKAAIVELNSRGNVELTPADVRKIAVGKTGVLFSWCGFATSVLCKKPEAIDNLWRIGEHIGVIFQLADDLKDFDGDKALKDVCRDLRNLEPSMPIVLAMQENPLIKEAFQKAQKSQDMSESKALLLKDMIMATKALDKTKAMMAYEVDQALTLLSPYQGSLGQDYVASFVAMLVASH
jgi:geranylgeranyl pyrophosphate synthase